MFYTACLLYTGLCTRCSKKDATVGSFVEHFNEKQVKYILWFSSLILLNLIQNGFLARLACVHDALWKSQLVASFGKAI